MIEIRDLRFRWPRAAADCVAISQHSGCCSAWRCPRTCGHSLRPSSRWASSSVWPRRALIGAPELVIAGEPTSALDAALRDGFMDLLLGATREHGSTRVFVSHDERLAARFDSRLSLPELNEAGR